MNSTSHNKQQWFIGSSAVIATMAFKGLKECLLNSRHIYPFYSWVKELVFLASPGVTFVTHQSCTDSYVFSLPKYPFLTFSPDQSACPYFKWQSGLNLLQEPTGLCAVASGIWVSVPGGEEVEQASCLNAIVLAGSGNASGCVLLPTFVIKGVLCMSDERCRQRLNKVHKIFNSSVVPVRN